VALMWMVSLGAEDSEAMAVMVVKGM
jgi:hypothetical protein